MMLIVVQVCSVFGLVVCEKKTVTMHQVHANTTHMRRQNACRCRRTDLPGTDSTVQYQQTDSFVYLGCSNGSVIETPDAMAEITRRKRAAWMRVLIVQGGTP